MKVIHHYGDGREEVISETRPKAEKLARYAPLIALIGVALAAAVALSIGTAATLTGGMHFFMGIFLTQFALVKLFDLKGFAEGFAAYDLLGAKSRVYALVYPFLELGLGLLYLSFLAQVFTYMATIILLGFGALGVIKTLRQGKDLHCACMGSVLNVPLSHVTLGEDLGMAAMAAGMLMFSAL